MKIFLTDISNMDDNIMNKGLELVTDYRRNKVERCKFREDKERSLAAGLLLNYATKVYAEYMKTQIKYELVIDDIKDDIECNVENNSKDNNGCDGKYNKENNIEYKTDGNIIVNVRLDELVENYDASYDYDIEYVANGKPVYRNSDIYFNLSHAGNYVVCAVSDKAVGVDIERLRKNVIRVAKRFFTQAECDWIGNDSLKFSRIWTLKEAYAKLTGEGIAGTVSKAEFRHEADNGINNAVVADNAICSDNIEKVKMYISGKKVDNIKIYELNIIKSEYAISAIEYVSD